MVTFELINQIHCENVLGEGVQWNQHDKSIWWTDIKANAIYRYSLPNKRLDRWETPEPVGCFAFVQGQSDLLVAFASGFAWYNLETKSVNWIARPETDLQGVRLNDGRVDRQGRFWAGSIVEDDNGSGLSASLYCIDRNLHLSKHLTGLKTSNGLCWSLDSKRVYHADSPSQIINVYDFDVSTGNLSNGRIFARTNGSALPDGSCIDAADFLWNAQWNGGRVVRYSTNGAIDTELELPVSQPTCVAFGGNKMDLLFVSSARLGLTNDELTKQPGAGDLFIYRTSVRGVEENWFEPI